METPFLQELERSLRLDDPDLLFEVTPSGAAHIRTRLDADQEPAVLFAPEEHLAAAVTAVGEGCRGELWPDSTITAAGFNLLLIHLDEIAATRDTTHPIVMTRQGWQWPEPPEETWRPPGDYEPGDLVWWPTRTRISQPPPRSETRSKGSSCCGHGSAPSWLSRRDRSPPRRWPWPKTRLPRSLGRGRKHDWRHRPTSRRATYALH